MNPREKRTATPLSIFSSSIFDCRKGGLRIIGFPVDPGYIASAKWLHRDTGPPSPFQVNRSHTPHASRTHR